MTECTVVSYSLAYHHHQVIAFNLNWLIIGSVTHSLLKQQHQQQFSLMFIFFLIIFKVKGKVVAFRLRVAPEEGGSKLLLLLLLLPLQHLMLRL